MTVMIRAVVDRLEHEWGDPMFRGGHPQLPLSHHFFHTLDRLEGDSPIIDVAGAWLDAYARLPGIRWLLEKEAEYAEGLDAPLAARQLLLATLGHPGKTLGEQVDSARRAGLFAGFDTKLGVALENLADQVASVRNQMGDAHPGAAPDLGDAELVYRVVLSIALRLVRP